jgi:hypothetical protein
MRRAAIVVVALFVPAPVAGAATLRVDRGCYLSKQDALPAGQQIIARGEGWAPNSAVSLTIGGTPIGVAAGTNAAGTLAVAFSAPALPGGQFKATRTLAASDGVNQASTPVALRVLAADFSPATTQNAVTQRVRFLVYGFGPLLTAFNKSTVQTVYMHVFQPGGRRRGTFNVGRTSGPCGDLRTRRRKILPFGLKNGTWTYRFTTARRYSARSLPQSEVGFRVQTVFRPG